MPGFLGTVSLTLRRDETQASSSVSGLEKKVSAFNKGSSVEKLSPSNSAPGVKIK